MALEPGTVLDVPELGVRLDVLETAATTGGAAVVFELTGRPRGVIAVPHVHGVQSERHEVLEGELRLSVGGRRHRLGPGDAMTVPAGTRHRQRAGRHGRHRVRVRVEPAGDFEAFVERLAEISAAGDYDRLGMPKPRAGARLLRDFGAGNRFAYVPLRLQRRLAARLR
jgi:mannose-6-phosphate isomerase-like protein (cupin superfamily)